MFWSISSPLNSNFCPLKTKWISVRWGIYTACMSTSTPGLGSIFSIKFYVFCSSGGGVAWLVRVDVRTLCEIWAFLNRSVWTKANRVITAGLRKSELCCVYQSNIIGLFLFDTNLKCQQFKASRMATTRFVFRAGSWGRFLLTFYLKWIKTQVKNKWVIKMRKNCYLNY